MRCIRFFVAIIFLLGCRTSQLSAQIELGPTGFSGGGGISSIVTGSQIGPRFDNSPFSAQNLTGSQIGPRLDNSPFSAQSQNIGALRAGSRFQRRTRRRGQFVGSDTLEQQSFVGAVQGATNPTGVTSATGVTTDSGPSAASVNRTRQPSPATAKYDPTLVVAFDVPRLAPESVAERIGLRISRLSELQGSQVSVWVDGRTAVIQGTVGSARQRRFVERYLQMEPGISSVDNELQIVDGQALPSTSPGTRPSERLPREVLPIPPEPDLPRER